MERPSKCCSKAVSGSPDSTYINACAGFHPPPKLTSLLSHTASMCLLPSILFCVIIYFLFFPYLLFANVVRLRTSFQTYARHESKSLIKYFHWSLPLTRATLFCSLPHSHVVCVFVSLLSLLFFVIVTPLGAGLHVKKRAKITPTT